jgi:hypothetical protein
MGKSWEMKKGSNERLNTLMILKVKMTIWPTQRALCKVERWSKAARNRAPRSPSKMAVPWARGSDKARQSSKTCHGSSRARRHLWASPICIQCRAQAKVKQKVWRLRADTPRKKAICNQAQICCSKVQGRRTLIAVCRFAPQMKG